MPSALFRGNFVEILVKDNGDRDGGRDPHLRRDSKPEKDFKSSQSEKSDEGAGDKSSKFADSDEDRQEKEYQKHLRKEISRLEGERDEFDPSSAKWQRNFRAIGQLRAQLKPYEKDNVVLVSFDYPRSGEQTIGLSRSFALDSGRAYKPTDAFDARLFKEEVQGETTFKVSVTDKDPRNPFFGFMRRLLVSVFKLASGGSIKAIDSILVRGAIEEQAGTFGKALGGKDDKEVVTLIAESPTVKVRIRANGQFQIENQDAKGIDYKHGRLKLTLKAPKKFGNLSEDLENGYVILDLKAEAL